MSDLPKAALAPADAPWPGNPAFTRKEAGEAKTQGRVPMTPEIAEMFGDAIRAGIPPEEALQKLGFTPRAAKHAVGHELIRMVWLRVCEEAGITLPAVAQGLKEDMSAEKVEVAKFQGTIGQTRAFPDVPTRHTARRTFLETAGILGGGRSAKSDESDARPMLNVQADANVQINVYFGEARGGTEPGSDK